MMKQRTCDICGEKIPNTIHITMLVIGILFLLGTACFWILKHYDLINPAFWIQFFMSIPIPVAGLNIIGDATYNRRCPNEGLFAQDPERMHFEDTGWEG